MHKGTLVLLVALVALATGCGSDDKSLSRSEVEQRVARQIGDREAGRATAKCAERSEKRLFRCEVTVGSVTSNYNVLVSKDGKRVQLDER